MTNDQRIRSALTESRRNDHREAASPQARARAQSSHMLSEAVVAGYIHDLSQRRRRAARSGRERRRGGLEPSVTVNQ